MNPCLCPASLGRVATLALLASGLFAAEAVQLNWLGQTPAPTPTGVSWGVPWPKGAVQKEQAFSLVSAAGKALPLQSWPPPQELPSGRGSRGSRGGPAGKSTPPK